MGPRPIFCYEKTMGRDWYRKVYEREMILSRLQPPGPFSYVIVLDHLKASYNVPKIIRAANALGCREIHMVGIELFNPSPAKGTLRQTRTRSFEKFDDSYAALNAEGYSLYALEPTASEILGSAPLPEKCAFIVGHEEYGLSFDREKFPAVRSLGIRQFGKVQSLNVSIAASLACYEWVRQNAGTLSESQKL